MKFKKIAAGVLSLAMLASFTACGSVTTTDSGSSNSDANLSDDENDNTDGSDDSSSDVPSFSELYGDETIQLTVYSQLANYSGKLTGWFAEVMKQKFNVEMTIIPEADGAFDTRMESGNLGDIVIFGSSDTNYQRAALGGYLFDWNEDDILSDYGPYIKENMSYALEHNAELNASFGAGDGDTVYGFGHNVASSTEDHESFFYTMDIRWDLYKELGYPELNTLDDFYDMLVAMKEICPTDEVGNPTYAASLWPDWDGDMVMYVKSFATCYWGYEGDQGLGHYNTQTGDYYYALDEGSPYLTSLKFFNKLYQAGLIDPNSMTQTYNEVREKTAVGGTFFSIFNYSGSSIYNTEDHLSAGKAMYSLLPDDATTQCAGMNVLGGGRVWTIGANTEYPELCMAIINYLATPEGYMTYLYGPKDVCWYYDDEGYTCFTELGEAAYTDRNGTIMPDEWGGISFNEGSFQANNTTWTKDASNPDSNGETYNADKWRSRVTDAVYDILEDWRNFTGCYDTDEYLNTTNYIIAPATAYSPASKSDDLNIVWSQVKGAVVNYSWQAIYASSDEEYDKIVAEMIQKCNEYDPEGLCREFSESEAAIRNSYEEAVR